MSKKYKHNKKRNIGIIYELLLRHMSNSLIEGNKKSIKYATKLIEKRFNKQSEIYKEFRLFNALANTETNKTEIVAGMISESKKTCKLINNKKLEQEKSALIHDINHNIIPKDNNFYYRSLSNYRDLGTIQLAINEWKKGNTSNLKKIVEIEEKIIDIIAKSKKKITYEQELSSLKESKSNKLVYKIMTEKINNKYNNMTSSQKIILKAYAIEKNNPERLTAILEENKKNCIEKINSFHLKNENIHLSNKINEVKNKINQLDPSNVNDNSIIKFLTITNLIDEIKE